MIYFITDGEYVKVGFTDNDDVSQRLATLQIGNARELKLLGMIQGGTETEAILHRVLKGLRVRGEWFMLNSPPEVYEELVESGGDHVCEHCGRGFSVARALGAHSRYCPPRQASDLEQAASEAGVSASTISRLAKQMNGTE